MVTCELCRRAELTPRQRLRENVLALIGLGRRPTIYDIMRHSSQGMMLAAMGGAVTTYDRHRDAYVRTGDPAELQRMLRHVQ